MHIIIIAFPKAGPTWSYSSNPSAHNIAPREWQQQQHRSVLPAPTPWYHFSFFVAILFMYMIAHFIIFFSLPMLFTTFINVRFFRVRGAICVFYYFYLLFIIFI